MSNVIHTQGCCSTQTSPFITKTEKNDKLPVAIIGAGPVGLAAAAHLASRRESFILLEAGSQVDYSLHGLITLIKLQRACWNRKIGHILIQKNCQQEKNLLNNT